MICIIGIIALIINNILAYSASLQNWKSDLITWIGSSDHSACKKGIRAYWIVINADESWKSWEEVKKLRKSTKYETKYKYWQKFDYNWFKFITVDSSREKIRTVKINGESGKL